MLAELITAPHISFNITLMKLITLAYDGIIGKMHEFVIKLSNVVVDRGKSNIALAIYPDSQWIPIGHKYPLTYIKLLFLYNQRVLYVLLHNEWSAFDSFYILHYLFIWPEDFYSSSSRFTSWFDDPDIMSSVYAKLGKPFLKFIKNLNALALIKVRLVETSLIKLSSKIFHLILILISLLVVVFSI